MVSGQTRHGPARRRLWRECQIMSLMVLLTIACALGNQDGVQKKPKALLALEQARLSLFSGTVHWTYVDESWYPGREFAFVCCYAANGDRIFEERGEQDGAHTCSPKNADADA